MNDDAIIEKFEPANVRDDFEYAFKMFSKALDVILQKKKLMLIFQILNI